MTPPRDDNDDRALLQAYAAGGPPADPAFAELVRRHVDMVYAAARRQLPPDDAHLADDVVQGVFLLLAQKAHHLTRHATLAGWLYETTRYAAANARRGECRRRRRQQAAAQDRKALAHMATPTSHHEDPVTWDELKPALDDAMARLRRPDRDAIVLRFLEGKSLADVGRAMGTSEDAAKQRVLRAVARLRDLLVRRQHLAPAKSAACTVGGVMAALASARHADAAAPAALRAAAAKAGSAAGGSGTALTIASGVNQMIWWTKLKIGITVVAAATSLAVAGTAAVKGWGTPPARPLADQTRAPAAAAPPAQEPAPDSPRAAMLAAFRAGWAGDRDAVRAMVYANTDDERRLADAFADMMSAGGDLTHAMRDRWPNDPLVDAGAVAPFSKAREQAIMRATETIEGPRAKLVIDGMGPALLTHEGGSWQLWGASMAWTGEGRTAPAAKAARMHKESDGLRTLTAEIRAGKYPSARDAMIAHQKRLGPVHPTTRKR